MTEPLQVSLEERTTRSSTSIELGVSEDLDVRDDDGDEVRGGVRDAATGIPTGHRQHGG